MQTMQNEELSTNHSDSLNSSEQVDPGVSHESHSTPPRDAGSRKEKAPSILDQFLKELDQKNSVESKIEYAIDFMEKSIAKEQNADFKAFWEARMKCLTLFKENIPPFLRNQYWVKFSELSKQARRLKDMLDNESDFAAEQIDIAVSDIEKGLDQLADVVKEENGLELPVLAQSLKENFNIYNDGQQELKHLNLFATRITSLRKELIKTEMRVRSKNKFFERLSKAGDRIFPRRKELIQEISQVFAADVENFIEQCFRQENRYPTFDLREEIKALQSAAKIFTLNTQTFSQTRLVLSECWDKLKEKDKERKIEFDKRKEFFKQNAEELKKLIDEAVAKFEAGESTLHQSLAFIDEMQGTMRKTDLGKDDVKNLRDSLALFRDKLQEKQRHLDEERLKQEDLRNEQKRELFEQHRKKCQELLDKANDLSAEEIVTQKELLAEEIQKSALSKLEKIELDKLLKQFKEILREKKEQALMALPDDEKLALQQLKELLVQKKEQRNEFKEKVEQFRKLLGTSNLSFEKSLEYNERMVEEKMSYEKAQKAVQEIEMKIGKLET